MKHGDGILPYFRDELRYLRREGERFARRFPELARRLALSERGSADPHVERLLEGVAFLTARVQKTVDDQLPELARTFLDTLYPHYLRPIPPLALVELSARGEAAGRTVVVPRGLQLFARVGDGLTIKFQTCYETTIWPLRIEQARLGTPTELELDLDMAVEQVLAVRVRALGTTLEALDWSRPWRLCLDNDATSRSHLLELLLDDLVGVEYSAPGGVHRRLTDYECSPVGFAEGEEVLPYPSRAERGYRVLHEYFAFPRKFEFVDLKLAEGLSGEVAELYLGFARRSPVALDVDAGSLRLGVTPVINLFPQIAEPIVFDRRSSEHRVVPDRRWDDQMEVHNITALREARADGSVITIEPLYANLFDPDQNEAEGSARGFTTRRRETILPGVGGDDLYLTVAESLDDARSRGVSTLHVHTMCSNRGFASRLVLGQELLHESGPGIDARLLTRPSTPLRFDDEASVYRRLVGHITASRRALLDDDSVLDYLREVLGLYSAQVRGGLPVESRAVLEVQSRVSVRYLPELHASVRGIELELSLDEHVLTPNSSFLFEAVLNEFLTQTVPIGSFCRLRVRSNLRSEPREWSTKTAVITLAL